MKPVDRSSAVTAVVLGVLIVGMTACMVPTHRGLGIRPVEALKGGVAG
jgi:ABC-type lipoprotein release transport system permease subunit